ncbi:hypothetical protein M9458_057736 [Cirrhinus mrigala]|uniref:Uncharacterized protein n=1 Tax=Cirrhinus mrigala TaxID=683832 RepID=A0ABD0MCY1_CIRMR
MALSKNLKRKVSSENRIFHDEWTENYAFILPSFINAKPTCLICNEVVSLCKEYNIRRHHETKHANFKVAFPQKTEARKRKIEALKGHSNRILVRGLTSQQKVTSASLKASWVLAKHNRPFTDAEVFKEMMVTVLEELDANKSMDGVIESVKQMSLSARSAARRIEALSDAVQGVIIDGVSHANYFSLAIDESTDNTDVAQLCVYVRYFDGKDFKEELLFLFPLEGHTTEEAIYAKLEELFKLHSVSFERVNLIVTDGAPAMVGKHRGLVSRLKEHAPQMHALHCLIHQSVLCARLNGELKDVMDKVMKVINFVRDATHDDLLLHNDVRWLSKGKALDRFCALLNEIKAFFGMSKSKAAADHLILLEDEKFMSNVAFLSDIFGHLNLLNLQLQGRDKTIVDMVEKLESFTRKLEMLEADISTGRLLHFSTLKKTAGKVTELMVDFIKGLRANFISRFDDYSIPKDIIDFIRDPAVKPADNFSSLAKEMIPSLDQAALEMEMVDFQTTSVVRDALRSAETVSAFWVGLLGSEEYSNLKKLALFILTMFPSTYVCESSFSAMNAIKTHKRNRLTNQNLENCLRIKSEAEHHHHVAEVLQRLREHQLYLKAEKCSFHQRSVQFLRYVIDHHGVRMDEGKVDAVVSWPKPNSIKELQRFLGFANFYRRFIQGFSHITNPLTNLLKGHPKTLNWTIEASTAFETLKKAFTQAPLLTHPDPDLPFVVEVDASTTGVGAVLSQHHGTPPRLHPCAYFSRKLSPAEKNYDIGNRELLAIKLALEEWRHWLKGANHPFQVITDHKNLQYLRDAKRLCPRQARWALFFTRFNFSITYRPGSRNVRADALSRLSEGETNTENSSHIIPDHLFVSPIDWTEPPAVATPEPRIPPGCPLGRQFIPPDQGGCKECAMSKSPRHLPAGKLHPLPVPNRPWSHLGVDFMTDHPVSDENTCILVIIDRFSKFCRLIPLKRLPTALETAECLFNHVFRYYGLPEDIVSDRGPQFISRVWKAFFKLLGVTVSLSSGYHPQTNGQTERKIQEVGWFLRTFCHGHQNSWNQFLGWAEYAQNSLRQPSTGLTPFQCVLGFQPPLFPWNGEPSDVLAVDHWFRESERVWDAAHHHLQRAVNRSKAVTDRRRIPGPNFTPGQKVWLSTRDIRLCLPSKKLSPRFIGPFTILEQVNPVTYKLQLPPQYRIHPTFHVSLLKPCHEPLLPSTEPGHEEEPPPPMVLEEGSIYSVKEILQSRRHGGRLEYLVDWEGYGPEERSWVPRDDILDPTLILEFHAAHPEYPAPRGRGRPPRRRRSRPSGAGRGEGVMSGIGQALTPVTPSDHNHRSTNHLTPAPHHQHPL